jgi:tRNA(Ile)-lysidine synthase
VAGPGGRPDRLTAPALLAGFGDLFAGIDGPVVVACSGGTDSLALLALAVAAGLEPTAVHVDHGARPGSGAEAEVVAGLARRLGAGFAATQVSVAPGPGFEARARTARYDALERARVGLGAKAVLVGHTRDDQAETMLLNLLRGGGVTGLAGIPPRRGTIVRPLLPVPRAALTELCARHGLVPLEDPMNADCSHRRVWLRREVIPALEAAAGRDLRALLARQAELFRADSALLDSLAAEALEEGGASPPTDIAAATLTGLPPALGRRAVRSWLGSPPPALEHTEAVLEVAHGRRRSVELPGGRRVVRSGGRLRLIEPAPAGPAGLVTEPETVPIDLPGAASAFGLRLEAWVERAPPVRWPDGRWTAVLDADRAGDQGVVRAPLPAERFVPLGLDGHKAISDALAEAGIPAEHRRRHPVLADRRGEPLWVLGYRISDRVRVGGDTRRFLWVTAEGQGE